MIRDESAAGAFYDTHFPLVYAYFRRRTADVSAAEDLTAETFERILGALDRFVPGSNATQSARVWVYRIAGNVYKNHLRGVGRETSRMAAWARGWHPADSEQIGVEASIVLGEAVSSLAVADRNVLGLWYWESLSAPEIAQVVGGSSREVYTTIDRCLRQLRRRLGVTDRGLEDEYAREG